MPYALIIAGLILTVAGARGTQGDLFTLLKGDFTGNNSFICWAVAIFAIGSIGYVDKLRPASNAMLALVLIVLVLSNKGVFAQFTSAIKTSTTATPQLASIVQR